MTVVTVFRRHGRPVGFSAEGHAGYADAGSDIVCAAVSAITQTAALGITELVKCAAALEMRDGRLRLMLDKTVIDGESETRRGAELILGTMLLGLCSVRDEYSDYLRLTEREV